MKQLAQKTAGYLMCALLVIASLTACSKHGVPESEMSKIDYWTCTMHPSVHSQDPGKCPICSMTLVPVMKKDEATSSSAAPAEKEKKGDDMKGMEGMPGMSGGSKEVAQEKPGEFRVPMERQQQIGVTYAIVEMKPLHHTIRAAGKVAPDTLWVFRVMQKLFE